MTGCSPEEEPEELPTYALTKVEQYTAFTKYNFTYPTLDTHGQRLTLSGCVAVPVAPDVVKPTHIVLSNMFTLTADRESPTNSLGIMPGLIADNCVVVQADYDGFGVAADRAATPLSLKSCGRQVTDCLIAALKILEDRHIPLAENWYTWNIGASLGGGVTLAVHRYIETELPQDEAEKLRLKWSYCASGPYNPTSLMDSLIVHHTFRYLRAMPIFINGLMADYPEYFTGMSVNDFFLPKVFESGFYDKVMSREYDSLDVGDLYRECFGESDDARQFLSAAVFDKNSKEHKAMWKALEENDLLDGWLPQKAELAFYHSMNDSTIYYSCSQEAYEALSPSGKVATQIINPVSNPQHLPATVMYYSEIAALGEKTLYRRIFR